MTSLGGPLTAATTPATADAACLHVPPCEVTCPQLHTRPKRPTGMPQRCVCGTDMEYDSEEGLMVCRIASYWPPQ